MLLNAVQKMQDKTHLKEEISFNDLSKVSLFSPWHSYRLFTMYTNNSPAEYIRKLRLAKSSEFLRKNKWQVTDIAFELGFMSVDGFIRAFSHEYGITPGAYKQNPVPISLFIPYGVKFSMLKKEKNEMQNVKNVFIQGEPFNEEDYCEAITQVQESIEKYNPSYLSMRKIKLLRIDIVGLTVKYLI